MVNFSENEGCANVPIYNLKGRRYTLVYDLLNDVEYIKCPQKGCNTILNDNFIQNHLLSDIPLLEKYINDNLNFPMSILGSLNKDIYIFFSKYHFHL